MINLYTKNKANYINIGGNNSSPINWLIMKSRGLWENGVTTLSQSQLNFSEAMKGLGDNIFTYRSAGSRIPLSMNINKIGDYIHDIEHMYQSKNGNVCNACKKVIAHDSYLGNSVRYFIGPMPPVGDIDNSLAIGGKITTASDNGTLREIFYSRKIFEYDENYNRTLKDEIFDILNIFECGNSKNATCWYRCDKLNTQLLTYTRYTKSDDGENCLIVMCVNIRNDYDNTIMTYVVIDNTKNSNKMCNESNKIGKNITNCDNFILTTCGDVLGETHVHNVCKQYINYNTDLFTYFKYVLYGDNYVGLSMLDDKRMSFQKEPNSESFYQSVKKLFPKITTIYMIKDTIEKIKMNDIKGDIKLDNTKSEYINVYYNLDKTEYNKIVFYGQRDTSDNIIRVGNYKYINDNYQIIFIVSVYIHIKLSINGGYDVEYSFNEKDITKKLHVNITVLHILIFALSLMHRRLESRQ